MAWPKKVPYTGVSVSRSTLKMGAIPSVSLPPITSCGNCKLCKQHCYALDPYRRFPNVKEAWDRNWTIYNKNIGQYFVDIKDHILHKEKNIKMFRWHVGGDIPSQKYMEGMALMADEFSEVKFLCFTKMYFIVENHIIVHGAMPNNMATVLSAWPGMRMHNPYGLPVAWVQDGSETRVPEDAIMCTGECESCGMCWELPRLGVDVCFYLKNGRNSKQT